MDVYGSVTLGTVTRALAGNTARVLETVHRPHASLDWHEHEDLSLDVVVAGSFQEHVGAEVLERGIGSVVVKPSGVIHRNVYGPKGTRTLVLHVSPTSPLLQDFGHLFTRVRHVYTAPSSLSHKLAEVMDVDHAASALAVDEVIVGCLAQLSSPSGRRVAERTLSAMRGRVLDDSGSASLTSIAEEFKLSLSAFSHAFRARYGCSPTTMQRRVRLERACHLLRRSRLHIGAIAAHAGFADQAHLTRECRRLLGLTPRQYRRVVA
jgi:AraC family transcriptional regulator